jgi:hypothetical protein
MLRWMSGGFVAVAVLSLVSCQPSESRKPTFAVTGKLLINGKPGEHATVVLHPVGATGPDAVRPRGKVAADGSFQLTTYDGNDGAPAGDYAVTVELWLAGTRSEDPPANRLNGKFAKPESSGLKATVKNAPTTLEPITITK